jgi:hypothetical protein
MRFYQEKYTELIALTQLYLLQEFSLTQRKEADFEIYTYFKNQVILEQKKMHKETPQAKTQEVRSSVPSTFRLEPLDEMAKTDLSGMKKLVEHHFPDQLNDKLRKAKEVCDVAVLTFHEMPKHLELLNKIAEAIQTRLHKQTRVFSAVQIEKENGWDAFLQTEGLCLVLATSVGVQGLPDLRKKYQETKHGEILLQKVPLLLLSDLSLYVNEPKLKAALWKELQRRLGR